MKPLTPQSMGRLGGLARAKKLSQQQRSEIARLGGLALDTQQLSHAGKLGAQARWKNHKKKEKG